MPEPIVIMYRADAAYRVSFEIEFHERKVIAERIASVLEEFDALEVRCSVEGPKIMLHAYVPVPQDVLPEALDRKAEVLRARWVGDSSAG